MPPYPHASHTPRAKLFKGVTLGRFNNFEGGRYADQNLSSVLFKDRTDDPEFVKMSVWSPSGHRAKPTFEEAIRARDYKPYKKGDQLGPSWSNHWVKLTVIVPQSMRDEERVQIEFDPGCEAMFFNTEGLALQGITGGYGGNRRVEFILDEKARSFPTTFYVEVSCNAMFGNSDNGEIEPPNPNRYYKLESADIVVPRMEAWHLLWDFKVLKDLARNLPDESPLASRALAVANDMMNVFDSTDLSTIKKARKLAEEIFGEGWQKKGSAIWDDDEFGDVQVFAVGNCHIDAPWLWPNSSTQQKVARSWSTQIDLIKRYPEFRFVASQAQQWKWLETLYPPLFDVVKAQVEEGTFMPIGGSWVECDTNMPSGEALCRQLIFGQRYFKSRFGIYCDVHWLPDTFGYSSQLPQLCRLAGMPYFFTQKLSWSQFNDFPHSTFNWRGLDGSQVLTHMTPVNTYTAQADVGNVRDAIKNHKNLQVTDTALLAYGNGDGGGGPLAPMIEGLRRIRATSNKWRDLPKVAMGKNYSISDMYKHIQSQTKDGKELPTWQGELYLELHRGTYTSHGSIKRHNRKCEILLRDIEHVATIASLQSKSSDKRPYLYPKAVLDELWEIVLVNQFHDLLPGSAIALAYEDAEKLYAHVHSKGKELLDSAFAAIIPDATGDENAELLAINTLPFARREVIEVPAQSAAFGTQSVQGGKALAIVETGVHSSGSIAIQAANEIGVSVSNLGNGAVVMINDVMSVRISSNGRITSIYDKNRDRELIPEGQSAGFVIFQDHPNYWDAWDVEIPDLGTKKDIEEGSIEVLAQGPLRASVLVQHTVNKSVAQATISLDSITASMSDPNVLSLLRIDTVVDWHERHKFLKWELPTEIYSQECFYETQFGYVSRPTHRNTTWDAAKFEVCAHKFADLSEYGYGVALLNDCKYGYACEGNVLRLSLLRSATAPDPEQDQGRHYFSFAVLPHSAHFLNTEIPQIAAAFNSPMHLRLQTTSKQINFSSLIRVDEASNVIVDTIKRGDDDHFLDVKAKRSVIVRLYESKGGHAVAKLRTHLAVAKVHICDLLERDLEEVKFDKKDEVVHLDAVKFRGFQVITLKLELA